MTYLEAIRLARTIDATSGGAACVSIIIGNRGRHIIQCVQRRRRKRTRPFNVNSPEHWEKIRKAQLWA